MKTGILGGGQLARMIMEECYKFGYEFYIFSGEENSPAGQLTKNGFTGDWKDRESLLKFAEKCDIITLENEFIDYGSLKFLEASGITVYPQADIIGLIQDKLYQKENLRNAGIPVAAFCAVESEEDIFNFISVNSFPVVLKSRTMGYDGKGNYTVRNSSEVKPAFELLKKRGRLMCESFINFDKEIATQIARNKSGGKKVYPVVETIQKDHICNMVIASDQLQEKIIHKANLIAENIADELNYVGVMGIEMFLSGDEITVNELAPRVHNSGHYTIEGCRTSQFENHIRAVLNQPLGNTEKTEKNAVMINILGERNGRANLRNAEKIFDFGNAFLHIYGKAETCIGRKMGHITVLDKNLSEAVDTAVRCREIISI